MLYGSQKKLTDAQIKEHLKNGNLEPVILSSIPIVFAILNKLHIVYNTEALLSAGIEGLVKATNSYDINRKPLIPYRAWVWYKITEAVLAELPMVNSILTFGTHHTHSAHIFQQNPTEILYLFDNTLNIEDPIIQNPCKELIKKEEDELKNGIKDKLLKVFKQVEVDSVEMGYKEFAKVYPNLSAKQHDNLRSRSVIKFKKYVNGEPIRNLTIHLHKSTQPIKPIKASKYKVCHKCKIKKLSKFFYKKNTAADGLSYICDKCTIKNSKERNATPLYRRKGKLYYHNNRQRIRDWFKTYRAKRKLNGKNKDS